MAHVWFQCYEKGHFPTKNVQNTTLDTNSNPKPSPTPTHINFVRKKLVDQTASCIVNIPRFPYFILDNNSVMRSRLLSFCVRQVPGTSHVATWPKKHTCERRLCPSLSRPFAAGPASRLFVAVQSVLDVIRIPCSGYNGSIFSSFVPLFFVFLSACS